MVADPSTRRKTLRHGHPPIKGEVRVKSGQCKGIDRPDHRVSTRYNAVKHGLLSQGMTELDELDYHFFLSSAQETFKPVWPIETALSEHICLCLVRLKRAHGLEA